MNTDVRILLEKLKNSAAVVRERIDEGFDRAGGWVQTKYGDIDWIKRIRYNESIVARMGVEVQISGRSDMLARDIVHIRNGLQDSHIDIGVIVVASDLFASYLTNRIADFSYAVRYVEEELREAQTYPMILIGIEHDGESDTALEKKRTNVGKQS